jgi:hypothetical protein
MEKILCPSCSAEVDARAETCNACGQRLSPPCRLLPVTVREMDRAKQRLNGILSGIAIDYVLTDEEIGELQTWLGLYTHLHGIEPFRTVVTMLNGFLEDQIIDESEREELLEWCQRTTEDEPRPPILSEFIRRFHGVLQGIAIDRKITEDEIKGLNDWLLDNEDLRLHWPFDDAFVLVDRIEFCREFSEEPLPYPVIHDEEYTRGFMISESPVCRPITYICDREARIVFDRRSFCFTGPAKSGPRRLFKEMVEKLGGVFHNTTIRGLDYLVIGAQSSPCWHYTTYGRKIETVMEERKSGGKTVVLFEDDFVYQANEALKGRS